jgi:hypothetical protein
MTKNEIINLLHEQDEANVLAEFINKKGLCDEYAKWSRTKFKKLDGTREKRALELL